MSTDRIKGCVAFTCDVCDDTLETGHDDFSEARTCLLESNWIVFRNDRGDWEHRCATCRRKPR